jgi:hypothetical protein
MIDTAARSGSGSGSGSVDATLLLSAVVDVDNLIIIGDGELSILETVITTTTATGGIVILTIMLMPRPWNFCHPFHVRLQAILNVEPITVIDLILYHGTNVRNGSAKFIGMYTSIDKIFLFSIILSHTDGCCMDLPIFGSKILSYLFQTMSCNS